jgi:transposase-like protein
MSCPEIGLHINVNEMDSKLAAHIINEHLTEGLSHRKLARKYGFSPIRIYRMLKKNQQEQPTAKPLKEEYQEELPDDIAILKEELRKARLKIELQDLMIDIASKELGVDIRKKSGTRQS